MEMRINSWTCDYCGELISCVEDGYLEWWKQLGVKPPKIRGMNLVHRYRECRYTHLDELYEREVDGSIKADWALKDYIGEQGLKRLLKIINESAAPHDAVLN